MSMLRLLAASLLASTFVLAAAAQAPSTSLTLGSVPPTLNPKNLSAPQTFTTNSLPSTFSITVPQPSPQAFKPYALNVRISPDALGKATQAQVTLKKQETLLADSAQAHQPCYTLRSYNFTARDLKSPHPHSSSETDCTPASSVKLKSIEIQGIKK